MKEIQRKYILNTTLLAMFLISPFVSSILAFLCLALNIETKICRIIVGLFFGLYGYLFIPAFDFDLVRHYEYFESYIGKSIGEFIYLIASNSRPDVLLYSLYWFLGLFYENPQIVGFIGAFPFYFLMLLSIDNIFKSYLYEKRRMLSYLILISVFMSLTVPWTFSTMRNGNAIILFVYLATRERNNRLFLQDCLLFILPGLIHFSLFPISALYILAKYSGMTFIKILSFIMIISFPFIESLLVLLYNILGVIGGIGYFIAAKINSYIIVGTDVNFYTGSSFRYYFAVLPLLIIVIPLWLYIDRCKLVGNNKNIVLLHKLTLLVFSFSLCMVKTYMFARIHLLFIYIFPVYMYVMMYNKFVNRGVRKALAFSMIYLSISFLPSLILGREFRGINPKLFYSNLFTILDTRVEPEEYWTP